MDIHMIMVMCIMHTHNLVYKVDKSFEWTVNPLPEYNK